MNQYANKKTAQFIAILLLILLSFGPVSAQVTLIDTAIEIDEADVTQWEDDCLIGPEGSVTIYGSLTVSSAEISVQSGEWYTPVFTISPGAELTFTNGSIFDLSGLGIRSAIRVEEGGTLRIIGNSKIMNANRTEGSIDPMISIENGSMEIMDGGSLENNTNLAGNFIKMDGGTLHLDHALIAENTGSPEAIYRRIISTAETGIQITASEIRDNHECVFLIRDAPYVQIDQSVFQNNSNESEYYGSTMAVYNSPLDIYNGSLFSNNTTNEGTTIFAVDGSTVHISDSKFTGNDNGDADVDAVIFADDSYVIADTGSVFTENNSRVIHVMSGPLRVQEGVVFSNNKNGAIYLYSQEESSNYGAEIQNAVFEDNSAVNYGGAIGIQYQEGHISVKLQGTIFRGNSAPYGGAIWAMSGNDQTITLQPNDTVFENNIADYGGGIYDSNSRLVIDEGTLFTENKASNDGGAIYKCGGYLTVTDGEFDMNEAENSGGAIILQDLESHFDKAVFLDNKTNTGAGAAIYIRNNASVFSADMAVTDNSGGGIRIFPIETERTELLLVNGGAVFGNTGLTAKGLSAETENYFDVYQPASDTGFIHPEAMFNGGKPNWKSEENGDAIYWKTDPTNTDISGARFLVQGNKSGMPFGGAIANEGWLIIGEGYPEPEPEPTATPEPTPTPDICFWCCRFKLLPRTGLSDLPLPAKPKDLNYKPLSWKLEIPTISSIAEIVEVPYLDGDYPVEWLGDSVGLLEGSSLPGKGITVLAGHNHINETESGPFALLKFVEEGEKIFAVDQRNQVLPFIVYANEKVASTDTAAIEKISGRYENSLILITCEDESEAGGYQNRRIVAARPVLFR